MARLFSLALLVLALAGSSVAQNQLATAQDASLFDRGIMFDVKALTDLRLTGVDVRLLPGLHDLEIYRVTAGGSFVGHENSDNDWTLVGSVTVYAPNGNAPVNLPLALDLALAAGTTQGLCIMNAGGNGFYVHYATGFNGGGIDVADASLEIHEGVGKGYPISSYTNGQAAPGGSSRKFRGVLHYESGIVGAEKSLNTSLFITPDDSEESITFNLRGNGKDVILTGLAADLLPGTHDLDLWVAEKYESHQAAGTNIANWRLIGSVTGFNAPGGKVRLPMDFEAMLPKGLTRGFYLTSSHIGGIQFKNVFASITASDLVVTVGKTYLGTFGTEVATNAIINATFFYRVPEQGGGITAGGTGLLSNVASHGFVDVGMYFDLKSNEPVVVESLDLALAAGTHTIETWVVTGGGTASGKEGNQALWTRVSTETVTVPALGRVQVAQNLRLFIPAGGVQGIYVTPTSNATNAVHFGYVPGVSGDLGSDGTMTVTTGKSGDYPFIPQTNNVNQPDVGVHYRHLGSAPTGFFEKFTSASGIQAPTGWISSFVRGNNPKLDGWRFDNPGNLTISGPMSAPLATCDTDYSGANNPIDTALISPRFDASQGKVTLSFDHYFKQYISSAATVEVWNGTTWNQVASYSVDTANPEHASFDISSQAGGSSEAMVRFRYTGNFDWWWQIDNIEVAIGLKGQRPQLGIGEFDINNAVDSLHGQPVSSGLPGPYVAHTSIYQPTIFSWDGEPNQPLQLFAGYLNLGNEVLNPQGQLDVGSYDSLTNTFPGIILLGDGTANDLINAAFRTSNGGRLVLPYYMPPYSVGFTYHFQSAVYSSTQGLALTNVVSLTIDP